MRLTPTEEELRSRYNPDLLKKSIEGREERQQEFDDFVTRLKEYSKSDKPSGFLKFPFLPPPPLFFFVVCDQRITLDDGAFETRKARVRELTFCL